MAAVANIITTLGIDTTLWIQLLTFVVSYIFLHMVVFTPYFKAFEARQGQTVGSNEKAEQIFAQTRELETLYQRKARNLNAEIKDIYDKVRLDAVREQEKIQAEAREKAKVAIEDARKKIQEQFNYAREELIKQTPLVSKTITEKLLPAEVRQ